MEQPEYHKDMLRVMEQNAKLIKENNKLLKKLYRQNVIGYVIRIVWYVILIGLPFALYFYILEPYFNALGSNYELFLDGIGEIPGIKVINSILP